MNSSETNEQGHNVLNDKIKENWSGGSFQRLKGTHLDSQRWNWPQLCTYSLCHFPFVNGSVRPKQPGMQSSLSIFETYWNMEGFVVYDCVRHCTVDSPAYRGGGLWGSSPPHELWKRAENVRKQAKNRKIFAPPAQIYVGSILKPTPSPIFRYATAVDDEHVIQNTENKMVWEVSNRRVSVSDRQSEAKYFHGKNQVTV